MEVFMKRFYLTKSTNEQGITTEVYCTNRHYIEGILETIYDCEHNTEVLIECMEVIEDEATLKDRAYYHDEFLDILEAYWLEV